MESDSNILIYEGQDGNAKIDVRLQDETVWLTQDQMAQLFGKAKSTINEHVKNIFNEDYLDEDEMQLLGLLVEQYLAFAETMAQQQTPMYMKDWIQRLDAIIQLNGRELLTHAGKISHAMAAERSALEYEKYRLEKKRLKHEESLQELECDIKLLSQKKNGKK